MPTKNALIALQLLINEELRMKNDFGHQLAPLEIFIHHTTVYLSGSGPTFIESLDRRIRLSTFEQGILRQICSLMTELAPELIVAKNLDTLTSILDDLAREDQQLFAELNALVV